MDIGEYLDTLYPSEKEYLRRVQKGTANWYPQSRPQWEAFLSRADEVFYGGAAGGGKTDLLLGMASECHKSSVLFRRVYPNLKGMMRRAREIIGTHGKENKSDKSWSIGDRTIEFGSVQYENDKTNWQGRPHDLKGFDELAEYTESQYVFICGWTRTAIKGQRVRIISTGNPPTSESGSWIIKRWSAWLDPNNSNPAKSGEIRWYAMVDGEEIEQDNGDAFEYNGETIVPRSRTFIRALLEDNPYLADNGAYKAVLQALPEPLRSQMLFGDFSKTSEAHPFQVIPTDWVKLAQQRWIDREKPDTPLTSVGVDPNRGGTDNMGIAKLYDNYFDEIEKYSGEIVKDGAIAAELIRQSLGNTNALIGIDVIGIGSSAFDHAKIMYTNNIVPINASASSSYRDRSGLLKMRNVRAEYYWRLRDSLDPELGDDIALPPGNEVIADLCAARYKVSAAGILIEEKSEIKKRLGRSPDVGDAIMLALQAQFSGDSGLQIY